MLGFLKLPCFGRQFIRVAGGPVTEASRAFHFVVKMAVEIHVPCDVSIPTRDFSVPEWEDLNYGLVQVLKAMLKAKDVYVGCMAGRGRTGLMMAVLAKAFGVKDPVPYVRANYYAHAVETDKQFEFVTHYQIPLKARVLVLLIKLRRLITI